MSSTSEIVRDLVSHKQHLAESIKQYRQRLNELNELSEALAKEQKECKTLAKFAADAQADRSSGSSGSGSTGNLQGLDSLSASLLQKGSESKELREELVSAIDGLRSELKQLDTVMPDTGGRTLTYFIGRVNIIFSSASERLQYKKEYEMFKLNFSFWLILFCIVTWYSKISILETVFHLSLGYYFITLILREKILKKNGSTISPWWFFHHYASAFLSFCVMTWRGEMFYSHFDLLNMYFIYFGILQALQTRYQMGRIYALRALGKANDMEIADTQSSAQLHVSRNNSLLVLLPLLVVGQIFQLFNGTSLVLSCISMWRNSGSINGEWQAVAAGLVFVVLGVGNFVTTIKAVFFKGKSKKQQENIKTKSK